jgi:hypothetical protein
MKTRPNLLLSIVGGLVGTCRMNNRSKGRADAEEAAQAAKWMTQRVESYKRTCRSLLAILTTRSDRAVWAGHVDITLLWVLPTDV